MADKNRAAKKGSTVQISFMVMSEQGQGFEQSAKGHYLRFVVGEGQVVEGIDEAVAGMNEGESKTVTIPPEKGFGKRDERMMLRVPRSTLPVSTERPVKPGDYLFLRRKDGKEQQVKVIELRPDSALLDLNHPLAGITLKCQFRLEVVD